MDYFCFSSEISIIILLQLMNFPAATGRFSYTVHLTNYSETFHDFNKSLSRLYYNGDGTNSLARIHNQLESISDSSQFNENAQITNDGLSRSPKVSVNVTSSSSRRHQRQETCMTFMWKRHLSHKVTPSMKSSTCRQYQKWGQGMKKAPPLRSDRLTMKWISRLGLGAFRHQRRHKRHTLRQRKEYRVMTNEERDRFHTAVRRLKQRRLGQNNRYDVFVLLHQSSSAPAAHFGPAFLGWHREMLFRFENALREIDPDVTIPYWDSTLDSQLGRQADDAVTWSDDFLGTRRGEVTSGPFADFSLVINVNGRNSLHRGVGSTRGQRAEPRLMTLEDVRLIVEAPDMRNISWFVDPSFEIAHGSVHNFVSGVFADLANSASDPLFFLHHAFIDCLWEEQRRRKPDYFDYQSLYPTDEQALGVGVVQPDGTFLRTALESPHHPNAEMRPFGPMSNIDGLSEDYSYYYTCGSRPTCSPSHASCDSTALFCDTRAWRCVAKLRIGATCSRWENNDPCYNGVCCEGVCRDQCDYYAPNPSSAFQGDSSDYRSQPSGRSDFRNQDRLPPFWNSSWQHDRFPSFPEHFSNPPFSPNPHLTFPGDNFDWQPDFGRFFM